MRRDRAVQPDPRLASPEHERAILSALLCRPGDLMPLLSDRLTERHFATRAYALMWVAILELAKDSEPISAWTLQSRLAAAGQLEAVGGAAAISLLDEDLPASDDRSVLAYLAVLDDRLARRRILGIADRMRREAVEYDGDGRDLFARTARSLAVADSRSNGPQSPDLGQTLAEVLPGLDRPSERRRGLPTGFPRLDALTDGMHRGHLWELAGGPGEGKTALMLQWADAAAAGGATVGVRTLEMTPEELTMRLLAEKSGVAHRGIRRRDLTFHQRSEVQAAAKRLEPYQDRIVFEHKGPRTLQGFTSWARRTKAQRGLDLLVIDHLDRMEGAQEAGTIPTVTAALKDFAQVEELCVLALRQFTKTSRGQRAREGGGGGRPTLADLPFGGDADADVVALLYKQGETINLSIDKARHDEVGTICLCWQPGVLRFTEAT